MTLRTICIGLTLTAPLFATACGDGAAAGRWAGRIDTLESGVVVVENSGPGLWTERDAWTVREDLRIGSAMAQGPELFGNVTGIVVDGEGRIHVLDRQAKELRTFAPDGAHVRTVGREGGGPGEFRDPIGLALGPDGERIFVVDPNNARYAVFDTEGEYRTSHHRAIGGYSLPWTGGFSTDGAFHEQIPAGVVRMDSAFEPVDTLPFPTFEAERFTLQTENGSMSVTVPFASRQIERWDPRGYLWTAVTGDYAITQMGPSGDTLRIIRRTGLPRAPVTDEDRGEAVERLDWFTRQGGRIEPSRIPSEKPYFTDFHIARDGHIWVRRTTAGEDAPIRYDVFEPGGRYLGEVVTSQLLGAAPKIGEDAIYGVSADSLGVEYVVRHRLDRSGAG